MIIIPCIIMPSAVNNVHSNFFVLYDLMKELIAHYKPSPSQFRTPDKGHLYRDRAIENMNIYLLQFRPLVSSR